MNISNTKLYMRFASKFTRVIENGIFYITSNYNLSSYKWSFNTDGESIGLNVSIYLKYDEVTFFSGSYLR